MKKLIFCAALMVAAVAMAAAPKCSVESEFWGRKYLKLTDVNGVVYKITTMPKAGHTIRFNGKTGWYDIDENGKIVRFQDPK